MTYSCYVSGVLYSADIWSTEVMTCASATFSLCRDGNQSVCVQHSSRRWAACQWFAGQKAISISGCADSQTSAGTGKGTGFLNCQHSVLDWIWVLVIYYLSGRKRDHFLAFVFCGTQFGIGGHFTRALTRPLARHDPHCWIILRCSQSFVFLVRICARVASTAWFRRELQCGLESAIWSKASFMVL